MSYVSSNWKLQFSYSNQSLRRFDRQADRVDIFFGERYFEDKRMNFEVNISLPLTKARESRGHAEEKSGYWKETGLPGFKEFSLIFSFNFLDL